MHPGDQGRGHDARPLADGGRTGHGGGSVLVVTNEADRPTTVDVGCRTERRVLFDDSVTLEPGETREWTGLPDEPFEVGLIHERGAAAGVPFDPARAPPEIRASVTAADVRVDDEDAGLADRRGGAGAGGDPAPEPSDGEPAAVDVGPGIVFTPDGPVSPVPLAALLLAVAVVVVVPLTWMDRPGGSAGAALLVMSIPSLFGVLAAAVVATGEASPGNVTVSLYSIALVATAIPVTLTADLLYVRRHLAWNPNRVLYPLGAVLVWPLAVGLYLYRRVKATRVAAAR